MDQNPPESSVTSPKQLNEANEDIENQHKRCCQALKTQITPKRVLILLIYLSLLIGVVILIERGALETVGRFADEHEVAGVIIFVFLIAMLVQPYGWGYTPCQAIIGFLYGWAGLPIVLGGAIIGSVIAFFLVRRYGRTCCANTITSMPPKQQLFLTRLNTVTAKRNFKSFAILIGCRLSPIPIGVVNMLLALTHVKFIDFLVTLTLGVLIDAPLGINFGILISQTRDLLNEDDDDVSNITDTGDEDTIAKIQLGITFLVTALFSVFGLLYAHFVWKEIKKADNESLLSKVDEILSKSASRKSSQTLNIS